MKTEVQIYSSNLFFVTFSCRCRKTNNTNTAQFTGWIVAIGTRQVEGFTHGNGIHIRACFFARWTSSVCRVFSLQRSVTWGDEGREYWSAGRTNTQTKKQWCSYLPTASVWTKMEKTYNRHQTYNLCTRVWIDLGCCRLNIVLEHGNLPAMNNQV